ncbi:MAG TPA: hypothetical protein VMX95_07890 [Thermodesulfobacteriota bacterium]|nr:hypothetical protein [Thermodesulfobacteriota bacterium]
MINLRDIEAIKKKSCEDRMTTLSEKCTEEDAQKCYHLSGGIVYYC